MHRSDTEAQTNHAIEAARQAALVDVRSRLAPLASAAGLAPTELDDLVLVVELSERILRAADPGSEIAAVIRSVLEFAYKTRLGVEMAPKGGIQ